MQKYLFEREMVPHWISASRSGLISFFHILTSYIPSLAFSCNNRIPSCTTTSASQGGTSPTRQPVVDEPISVVVEAPPPITDGAKRLLSVRGTRSTASAESSRVRAFNSSQPSPVHPIAVLFQRQELAKAVLGFAVPITTGIFLNQCQGLTHLQARAFAVALSVGFTATWNGMLLHGICPRVARALEYFGVGTILVAFLGVVSCFLPLWLAWVCWLCGGLSCLPFVLCLALPAVVEEDSSMERLDRRINV